MAQDNNEDPFSPSSSSSTSLSTPPESPSSGPPKTLQDVKSSVSKMFGYLMIPTFVGIGAGAVVGGIFEPMRVFELLLIVAIAGIPLGFMFASRIWPNMAEAVGALTSMAKKSGGENIKIKGKMSYPVLGIYMSMGACGLLFAGVVAANAMLDHSPITPYTLTVKSKSYSTGKHGDRHYYAVVESPAKPLLPLFDFDKNEHIAVNSSLYTRIDPGVTRVTLETHEGYLGIPWIASHQFVGPYAEEGSYSATPAPTAAVTTDNTDWAAITSFDMSIDSIPPDAMNREYWPNGYQKQEEPLVKGQIHGMAHYWFDNGKVYGDIPWNHGKKHGKFKLYRPDGSLDQVLSYKNGQPHGILEWYNSDGSVQQRWVYVDGVAKKRLK